MGNSATPLHAMLMGAAVILSTIAPVPTFAEEFETQELFKQSNYKESLDKIFCLEFVSRIARPIFRNGQELKHSNVPPDLTTMSTPSACSKSFVSNDAMVEAFKEWANEHIEKWRTGARMGVVQAMSDTWPCP